jgi:hypothetical protein
MATGTVAHVEPLVEANRAGFEAFLGRKVEGVYHNVLMPGGTVYAVTVLDDGSTFSVFAGTLVTDVAWGLVNVFDEPQWCAPGVESLGSYAQGRRMRLR